MERLRRFQRYLPWVSLAVSVTTAVLMNRKPERAPLVATAVGVGWFVVGGLFVLANVLAERMDAEKRPRFVRMARFARMFGLQSLTQLGLFFSLPFYVQASRLRFDHGIFLGLLATAAIGSLWDPLYEWILARAPARALLQGVATFAGLNCALPMVGLSNRVSLYVAAALTVLGLPLVGWVGRGFHRSGSRAALALRIVVVIAVPFLLLVGAASFVPPAPLQLGAASFGTDVADKALVGAGDHFDRPDQLVCFTPIIAPRGLRDRLSHVWRLHGRVRDRIDLEISGGREAGYRTWSIKKNLTAGRWTCTVQTQSGQVLGHTTAHVEM